MIVPPLRGYETRNARQAGERGDVKRDHIVHLVDVGVVERSCGTDVGIVDQQSDAGVGVQRCFNSSEAPVTSPVPLAVVVIIHLPLHHLPRRERKCRLEGQLANPLSRGGEDGVAHRGGDG